MGAMVIPPMPSFYNHPRSIDDIVDYTVARILDQFGLEVRGVPRWTGEMGVGKD
jgi:4-hydroxy-3-polyprenylbenzoate decarboxylase